MKVTAKKINTFAMLKLPAAWLCGVRVRELGNTHCVVSVRHRWINQNPFGSMFWAVQGMAAELSTGALFLSQIAESGQPISMLVTNNKASFTKKARGRITFSCDQGQEVKVAIENAIVTGEGQTLWMYSKGVDEQGDEVSSFAFEWAVKVKQRR